MNRRDFFQRTVGALAARILCSYMPLPSMGEMPIAFSQQFTFREASDYLSAAMRRRVFRVLNETLRP